jgi:hypothetical protein
MRGIMFDRLRAPKLAQKIVAALLIALSVAACGGGGTKLLVPQSSTSGTVTTRSAGIGVQKAQKVPIIETVRVIGPGAAYTSSSVAAPGQIVQFRTVLGRTLGPAKVQLVFTPGPGNALTATATAGGHTSRAIVKANAGNISPVGLRYSCSAPPAPSFCPIRDAKTTATTSSMVFNGTPQTAIFVNATIGKTIPPIAKANRSSSAIVPPYTVTATGRSIVLPTGGGKAVSSALGSAVTVKPGELVFVQVRAAGSVVGAPQKLLITLPQGPAATLTASASVSGSPASSVQLKSSNGSPVTIVLPRYTCFVPPAPTYCPPVKESVSGGNYTLEFLTSPSEPPVSLLASVEQG